MIRTFYLLSIALFVSSLTASAQLRKITTIAGCGTPGYGGDGFTATGALLNSPFAVAPDKWGNVYILDYYNNRIRKIKPGGTIVTFAGNGNPGVGGDGSYAASAELDPTGLAVDPRGNVYIADGAHGIVRKVNKLGIISRYAGNGTWGYGGDGGQAVAAYLRSPMGLCTDKYSNLYIADASNNVIRKVDTFGVITTIAGDTVSGYSGDGFAATAAQLDSPFAVAMDRMGNLFIADRSNQVIRQVDPSGTIYTVAGNGTMGYSGDHNQAISAQLFYPSGVAVDTNDFIYIADSYNNVVRMVDTLGFITTFAGNGSAGFGGDLGVPDGANLFHPCGVATDTAGNVYIADANNERVRKVYYDNHLGINPLAETQIEVYPNPVENEIHVDGLTKSDNISLYDMSGRLVVATMQVVTNGTFTFSVSQLTSGIYMLQVTDAGNNKKAIVKIVK